jgi:nucleoside-diphosphate-sugar epimerase
MRILVTGAAGFIGSHLVRLLVREGHSVCAVLQPERSAERLVDCIDQIRVFSVDLNDSQAVRSVTSEILPECAIHLAWYAVPGKYLHAPENLDCVSASIALAGALASVGCRRFVAAGTSFEYDWDYGFLSEEVTPLRPRSFYGVCKNAAREILQGYCEKMGMSFAWARIFQLYGPHEAEARLVPSVIRALLSGRTAKCTQGGQIRDYLHVEDVASAIWAVARCHFTGPVNIGSGDPVKVRAIVETIAQLLHREENVALGALPTDPQEPAVLFADVRRLAKVVEWNPSFSLREGLAHTCEWWRSTIHGT